MHPPLSSSGRPARRRPLFVLAGLCGFLCPGLAAQAGTWVGNPPSGLRANAGFTIHTLQVPTEAVTWLACPGAQNQTVTVDAIVTREAPYLGQAPLGTWCGAVLWLSDPLVLAASTTPQAPVVTFVLDAGALEFPIVGGPLSVTPQGPPGTVVFDLGLPGWLSAEDLARPEHVVSPPSLEHDARVAALRDAIFIAVQ